MLALCSADKTIKLFDISQLSNKNPNSSVRLLVSSTNQHSSGINSIAFSTDSQLMASVGED